MSHGYAAGDTPGNIVVAVHRLFAVLITVSGPIQPVPQIRSRAPLLHRWNGQLYRVAAFTASIAGLYMIWVRGIAGDDAQRIATTLNALVILLCAGMALRSALARDFATHRRWALRLFLAVSGVWFFRVGLMLSFAVFEGPVGFDAKTFQGPFLTGLAFAQFLLPLVVLEVYLRTQARARAGGRIAMAATLFMLTAAMGVGIAAASVGMWVPSIKAAYDSRTSISATLAATIASEGIAAAIAQSHALKSTPPGLYNFDERELNSPGYRLVREQKLGDAIRIFQLKAEAYPQ